MSAFQYYFKSYSGIIHDICVKPLPKERCKALFLLPFEMESTQTHINPISHYIHTDTHTYSVQCSTENKNNRIILKNSVEFACPICRSLEFNCHIRWERMSQFNWISMYYFDYFHCKIDWNIPPLPLSRSAHHQHAYDQPNKQTTRWMVTVTLTAKEWKSKECFICQDRWYVW